jgi:hypothetical protein
VSQRTFVGVDAFSVFQEVLLQPDEPRVCNVVEFGRNIGYLRVSLQLCGQFTVMLSVSRWGLMGGRGGEAN